MKRWSVGLAALMVVLLCVGQTRATIITVASAHGWPNERPPSQNWVPSLAIDGNLATYTWTTASFNTLTAHLGLDFGTASSVDRIRLWKDDEDDGLGSQTYPKDLVILYTTDSASVPLSNRTFQPVSGLTNGYLGSELMVATSVNSDGTVTGDSHDSVNQGHGWASLTFDAVVATGIAIQFQGLSGYNHYKVHEFEAYGSPIPEPSALVVWSVLGTLGIAVGRYRRRKAA